MLKDSVPAYSRWVDFLGPYTHVFSGGVTAECLTIARFRVAPLRDHRGVTVRGIRPTQGVFPPLTWV